MKATLKNFLANNLPKFDGGYLPGSKPLDDSVSDGTTGVLSYKNAQSWFVDVLEDGTAITYYPWRY